MTNLQRWLLTRATWSPISSTTILTEYFGWQREPDGRFVSARAASGDRGCYSRTMAELLAAVYALEGRRLIDVARRPTVFEILATAAGRAAIGVGAGEAAEATPAASRAAT